MRDVNKEENHKPAVKFKLTKTDNPENLALPIGIQISRERRKSNAKKTRIRTKRKIPPPPPRRAQARKAKISERREVSFQRQNEKAYINGTIPHQSNPPTEKATKKGEYGP